MATDLDRYFYLFSFISKSDRADFTLQLNPPLNVVSEQQFQLFIKKCFLPRIQVLITQGYVVIDEKKKICIPAIYISSIADLVQYFNEKLPENFVHLTYNPQKGITLVLHAGQSLRVSENYAGLLFDGKIELNNKFLTDTIFVFKTRQNFENNTYYLTCNLIDNTVVNKTQMPLLSTLVVHYKAGETQTNLLWESEDNQGKTYLKPGYHPNIKFQIRDQADNILKLKGGLFFLHLKLCT